MCARWPAGLCGGSTCSANGGKDLCSPLRSSSKTASGALSPVLGTELVAQES